MKDFIVCIMVRMENPYLVEFVEHYIDLGFSKVWIYDNGHNNEEYPNDVLGEYVNKEKVNIIPFRNKTMCHAEAYNDCLRKNTGKWILFIDADEFLNLTSHKTIQDYVTDVLPHDCNMVQFNWKCYGDNDLVRYDSRNVRDRFTIPFETDFIDGFGRKANTYVKTMLISDTDKFLFTNNTSHMPKLITTNNMCCNANGEIITPKVQSKEVHYENAFLEHYITKTIEEWVYRKSVRKYPNVYYSMTMFGDDPTQSFFKYPNRITDEKIKIAEGLLEEIKNNGSN